MPQEEKITHIPVDEVIEPKEAIRTVVAMEKLNGLADSIRQKGILEPLICVKIGDKYEITAGHRRYLAAKIAGCATLPCLVRKISEQDAALIKLHENYFREDINPIDEAKFFVQLHEKQNLAYTEIARLCCHSETYVMNRLQLLRADEGVKAALEAEQLNMSQALEIMKTHDEKIRAELLRITIESGATVSSLRIMRHDYESRGQELQPTGDIPSAESKTYPTREYLFKCPVCSESHTVNEMYPITVCKKCHDEFMKRIQGDESN